MNIFASPQIVVERRADGTSLLRSPVPLDKPDRCVGEWLENWALHRPQKVFLAERMCPSIPWVKLTYAEASAKVKAIASAILKLRLSAERPLVILSENSVAHALLSLAAMHVGVPAAVVSPAYSLVSRDFDKLKAIIELLDPGVIYVSDIAAFAPALDAIKPLHRALVVASNTRGGDSVFPFENMIETPLSDDVIWAFAQVGPDTISKILFTSGSTGAPKAVINTQRMLTSNQAAKIQVWPFLIESDLVMLDWLPWSHTFGGNHNFNMVLRNGGTFYIDGGKPMPGLFSTSLANLRNVRPTFYINVPRGFDLLVTALRDDCILRAEFFSDVRFLFYAGAALPQNLWEELERLSIETIGYTIPIVSAWGATETAPLATDCHFQASCSGNIGIPVPGTELKLVPSGERLEVRVRGPNVTPGYWKAPDLTLNAFDDEGFYLIGDAVRFADPGRPEYGLLFDGRIGEDFKLTSGTWVNVSNLRRAGVAALSPVAQDIVVCGHGGDGVQFLIFPNLAACWDLTSLSETAGIDALLMHPLIRAIVAAGLAKLKALGGGSSTFSNCALLMTELPSVDGGEITDKGYINQRAVLLRRSDLVRELADGSSSRCIGVAKL
jgi:feruloyl-CoA synthase